ncbi:MAG: TadG family pilus assembly protein [Gammaproteobacteria bacterium]
MKIAQFPAHQHTKRRQQAGAIGLSMILVLTSALLFTALAVDTGRLAMEKRRLQQVADLSALRAVDVNTCAGLVDPDQQIVAQAAQAAAQANGYAGDLTAEAGAVTLGSIVTHNGERTFSAARNDEAPAVRVVATGDYPTSLVLPALLGQNTKLQATAVATKQITTSIQLGSFLARLNTGDSILNGLLGGLLGTNVSLGLLDYKGIAAAQVTLLNLVEANANVGTVDELLKADVSVGEFLDILASAVDRNSTAAVALNELALLSIGPLPTIKLGDILAVGGANPEAALDAKVNVFDLLVAGLQIANKEHAISVPNVGINLGPIAQVGLSLYVIEPPKIAIGPPGRDDKGNWLTETETAQLRLQLRVASNLLGLGLLDLGVYLDAGKARAWVEAVQCATPADPVHHVTVGVQPSIVSLGLGHYTAVPSPHIEPSTISLLSPLLDLTVEADVQVQEANPDELTFDVSSTPIPNPPPLDLTQTVGTKLGEALANAVGNLAQTVKFDVPADKKDKSILGELLALALNAVIALLAPILGDILGLLGALILDPLLTALGIQTGGADVSLIGLDIKPTLLAI